jgi:hypothetical protein
MASGIEYFEIMSIRPDYANTLKLVILAAKALNQAEDEVLPIS